MQKLEITMLGPSGVGKTTLLTAMYEQFESNIGLTDLQLTPDDESSAILQDRLVELKSMLDVFEAKDRRGIMGTEAPAGPESLRSFVFGIGKKGRTPSLELHFRDYPGGYHTVKASSEEKEFVKNLLQKSVAVLIAIDAPALMEQRGKFHERINRPQQIKDLIKQSYQDLNSPRLVIFAPVKCEKYLKNEQSTKELINAVRQGYGGLLSYFNSEQLNPWIASVITPVQTVGSVVFSRLEVDSYNNLPHFYFRKVRHDSQYNPQDSEQPLRYLLRFLLKLHYENRSWGIFDFMRDWLSVDEYLKRAINEFANGCKTTDGFAILKGERWL